MRSEFVRRFGVWLLLAVGVALVAAWQMQARNALSEWNPDVARRMDQPIPVRTVKVDQRDLQETIGGTAVTLPAQTATISIPLSSSQVADREVKQLNYQPGSPVKQGETLMEFEPLLFSQIVRQREAILGQAQQTFATMSELQKHKAASALQVKDAEVAVETAQLELSLAKRDLELCTIKSPLDGVVEQVSVVPQMSISDGVTLAIVHQLDPIHVQMDFPMERIDALSIGQQAEVILDAFPQDSFTGKVIRIAPVVSTKTRVLPVIIEVANPENRIRAGISGFVRVKSERGGATTVPSVAVIKKQQKAMVVCVEDNRAKFREVHTGPVIQAGHVEVLDGLSSGEEVIIFGQDAVEENDVVNVDWHEWTRRTDLGSTAP